MNPVYPLAPCGRTRGPVNLGGGSGSEAQNLEDARGLRARKGPGGR